MSGKEAPISVAVGRIRMLPNAKRARNFPTGLANCPCSGERTSSVRWNPKAKPMHDTRPTAWPAPPERKHDQSEQQAGGHVDQVVLAEGDGAQHEEEVDGEEGPEVHA